MPFEGQLIAGCHSKDKSLSTTACTSVDTFAIAHALLDRVDGCVRPIKFVLTYSLCVQRFVPFYKKCRNFHLIISLWDHFEIRNNNKPFSSMSQLQSIRSVKQKSDNNYRTTRIVTKCFVQFFFRPIRYNMDNIG